MVRSCDVKASLMKLTLVLVLTKIFKNNSFKTEYMDGAVHESQTYHVQCRDIRS